MPNKKLVQIALIFIAAIGVFRFFFIPLKTHPAGEMPFILRVRIMHDINMVVVAARNRCNIYDAGSGSLLKKRVSVLEGTKVFSEDDGIRLGRTKFSTTSIRIIPLRNKGITVNGMLYRGGIDIIKTKKGFDVVNRVLLEDYLKGVLPREVHYLGPFEMIKAQVIASRSFAVYKSLRRKNESYDLTDDTFSQVYGGWSSERWRTTRAVDATEGKILGYKGKVLPAYFHSCCGGHTQNISDIWRGRIRPLRGVQCLWCRWSPYFRWQIKVPTETIAEKLRNEGYPVESIESIREGERDDSRRLKYVRVKSRNQWFELRVEDFRSAIGRRSLKSGNFHIKRYPFFYFFSGYGWGHGVGMCQWGAFGMSLRRWTYEKILNHYYPGTEIVDIKEIITPP